ncbi:probable galactinol--sucrose galactosyltransferase 6 isoform X2 [Cryptomeria japonica]|nr:probable galactinol--sucrose galactosyltransferase 6 isoform X2 [Cryptomeria japonica]
MSWNRNCFSLSQHFTGPLPNRRLENTLKVVIRHQSTLEAEEDKTSMSSVKNSNNQLIIGEKSILSGVPENVVFTCASEIGLEESLLVGALFSESKSRHVIPLGTLKDVRFLSCFRFKLWWMTQKFGDCGREIQPETQFLLLETKTGCSSNQDMHWRSREQMVYTVFLPLVEGVFRACLQGNEKDEMELCLESGDPDITESSFTHSLLVHAGKDPYKVITEAVRAVELHLQSFRHRDEKKMPGIIDWFGWCTWDAFYTDVSARGVEDGLKSLSEGGTPPRFVIIDDGWQSVGTDKKEEDAPDKEALRRLTHIKENYKFGNNGKAGEEQEDPALGIQHLVEIAKKKHNLKYVYVWHAITGYWGGVKPGVYGMEQYESTIKYPVHSPGVLNNEPGMDSDVLTMHGIGLVNPAKVFEFYNELHSYLAAAGVDGVKVDVQCILETLGAGLGGRVALTSQYHKALDASIARNFADNGCIACMSHNTDALYCSKQTAVVRASDDFFPRDPVTHTIHIASVAYNSVFLGEFMLPDWDMFHSVHPAGEFHAAARAVGGCPVYVSDKPGHHNFDLLRKLVLPDGSILRAQLPGRPTCDCLFNDPTRDGKSLLKIWNINKYTGVLGVFNCQGAAWSHLDKKNVFHDKKPNEISGSIHAHDVHLLEEVAENDWNGNCVVYSDKGELVHLPRNAALPITLRVLEHVVYTVTPIKNLTGGVSFAPIGLIDMFNSGGAINSLDYKIHYQNMQNEFMETPKVLGIPVKPSEDSGHVPTATIQMAIRGCGRFGGYSSIKPRKCFVDSSPTDFSYDSVSGLVMLILEKPREQQIWNVTIEV